MSGANGGIEDVDVAGAGLCAGECSSAAAPRRWDRAGGVREAAAGGWSGGWVAGVAGRAAGRHGERVGCGAALPVIFWRSPGRAAGLTLGGVVLTVNGDRDEVERQLAGGELACPLCGGVLGGWGNARLRPVRVAEGPDAEVVPRRSRCRQCGGTHVLLPAWCLLRRADAAAVIGAALEAAAGGDRHRRSPQRREDLRLGRNRAWHPPRPGSRRHRVPGPVLGRAAGQEPAHGPGRCRDAGEVRAARQGTPASRCRSMLCSGLRA